MMKNLLTEINMIQNILMNYWNVLKQLESVKEWHIKKLLIYLLLPQPTIIQ